MGEAKRRGTYGDRKDHPIKRGEFVSRMIEGAKPEPSTLAELRLTVGVSADVALILPVFETAIQEKTIYCCWSGGAIEDGQPKLTLVGRAALEALLNLPLGTKDALLFQELKLGPTPLEEKVWAALERADPGTRICFIGDMQGELDGYLHKSLKVSSEVLKINQ